MDCVSCFGRQAVDAARLASDDPAVRDRIVDEINRWAAEADLDVPPVTFAQQLHRRLRQASGIDDLFAAKKARLNRIAMELLPGLRTRIAAAPDPLETAVRLAIAGNVIDLGIHADLSAEDIARSMEAAMHEPLAGSIDALRSALAQAAHILYLTDNSGEIAFDRLLIERIGPERVTVAVRGGPILNDAIRADAEAVGLTDMVEVVDNGLDAPGALLESCSPEFRRRFAAADMIISKGQGNFEGLCAEPAPIWFLFKVKCAVVSAMTGLPEGTHVVFHAGGQAPEAGVAGH